MRIPDFVDENDRAHLYVMKGEGVPCREALKEFIPGRMIQFERSNRETAGDTDLKMNCDPAPAYKETVAVYRERASEWQIQNPQYVQYMQNGFDTE